MQYVCNNQSAKFYSLALIFSTLCIAHNETFHENYQEGASDPLFTL